MGSHETIINVEHWRVEARNTNSIASKWHTPPTRTKADSAIIFQVMVDQAKALLKRAARGEVVYLPFDELQLQRRRAGQRRFHVIEWFEVG